jgi:phosphatidate cytidylyltransferase
VEYAAIAAALGLDVPRAVPGAAVLGACAALGSGWALIDVILMTALIAIGAAAVGIARVGPETLRNAAAAIFPIAYIGLPLGALAAVRASAGREAVLLIMAAIVISDSAQYYTGRAFGRRPLSPTISPKKTVEGAIGGVVFGTLATVVGGHYVFGSPFWILALLGAAISLLGIVGDLFESLLKRSAGVKDSSNLIPGHGGVLDRIDSWLFAAPVYYVFVRFIA